MRFCLFLFVFSLEKFFLCVILKLCTEFKFPTMPATGQKVCGGGVVWWVWCGGWLKPTLVFSLAQAEQLTDIFNYICNLG
mgnify:CR=1 FL=1